MDKELLGRKGGTESSYGQMLKVTEGQHIQQESRPASAASMLEFASRNSKLSCCEEKTSTRAQHWRAYMSTSGGKKMDYNEKKVSMAESLKPG